MIFVILYLVKKFKFYLKFSRKFLSLVNSFRLERVFNSFTLDYDDNVKRRWSRIRVKSSNAISMCLCLKVCLKLNYRNDWIKLLLIYCRIIKLKLVYLKQYLYYIIIDIIFTHLELD